MASYWNYRIVEEDGLLSIREVYYHKGKPDSWTAKPLGLIADNIRDLVYDNYLMQKAFNKPVLKVVKNKLKEKE